MVETTDYRRWLASGETAREVLETFQVSHPSFKDVYVVNADRNFSAMLEDGTTTVLFNQGRFYAEPATVTDGTEQAMTVAFANGDGQIYDLIKNMTFDERETPIQATYRSYFLDDPNTVLVTPPPVWYAHSIEATREAIKVDLRAPHMRIKRVGRYYTSDEFPALRLI